MWLLPFGLGFGILVLSSEDPVNLSTENRMTKNKSVYTQMDEYSCMNRRMDRWMDGWVGSWKDGSLIGWVDGRLNLWVGG